MTMDSEIAQKKRRPTKQEIAQQERRERLKQVRRESELDHPLLRKAAEQAANMFGHKAEMISDADSLLNEPQSQVSGGQQSEDLISSSQVSGGQQSEDLISSSQVSGGQQSEDLISSSQVSDDHKHDVSSPVRHEQSNLISDCTKSDIASQVNEIFEKISMHNAKKALVRKLPRTYQSLEKIVIFLYKETKKRGTFEIKVHDKVLMKAIKTENCDTIRRSKISGQSFGIFNVRIVHNMSRSEEPGTYYTLNFEWFNT